MMDIEEVDAHLGNLTPHQLRIVQAVYSGDGKWMTRARVARSLGKRRLTPYDIACLKMLSDMGIVFEDKHPTSAPGSDFAYVYMMPDDIAQSVQAWAVWRESHGETSRRPPIKLVYEWEGKSK